jgi:AraC-like DNA-binding protein
MIPMDSPEQRSGPSRTSAARGEMASGMPHPELRRDVVCYRGYREDACHLPFRRVLPTSTVMMVVGFGAGADAVSRSSAAGADTVSEAGRGQKVVRGRTRLPDSFVTGLCEGPMLVSLEAGWSGLIVELTPPGAGLVFRIPMWRIANRTIPLDAVMGAHGAWLRQRLIDSESWEERFALLDRVLLRRAAGGARDELLGTAWSRMVESGGSLLVQELATEVGMSHRRLIADFREGIGLPPKRTARLLRCVRALQLLLNAGGRPRWSGIVATCGFYDQAHLINEIRHFTGLRPTDFASALARGELSGAPSWEGLRERAGAA